MRIQNKKNHYNKNSSLQALPLAPNLVKSILIRLALPFGTTFIVNLHSSFSFPESSVVVYFIVSSGDGNSQFEFCAILDICVNSDFALSTVICIFRFLPLYFECFTDYFEFLIGKAIHHFWLFFI